MNEQVMDGFFDELEKIGGLAKGLAIGTAIGLPVGALGLHQAQKAHERWQIGRAFQEQQEEMRRRMEEARENQ